MSIEVFDGIFPATQWQRAHDGDLVEAALTHGARNWTWHNTEWGVVFELEFAPLPVRAVSSPVSANRSSASRTGKRPMPSRSAASRSVNVAPGASSSSAIRRMISSAASLDDVLRSSEVLPPVSRAKLSFTLGEYGAPGLSAPHASAFAGLTPG